MDFEFWGAWIDAPTGLSKASAAAGYLDCAGSTGRDTRVDYPDFAAGDTFCVETNEGRWARVTITDQKADGSYPAQVTLNVLVWEKRGA